VAVAKVTRRVSAADRIVLLYRRPQFVALDEPEGAEAGARREVASESPDPEDVALMREIRRRLSSALATLSVEDRLLVRLHFERNVTLAKLAVTFGLSSPQAAHRRLRDVLNRLRKTLDEPR
jgi:RNA polymerase sigma factor (sigma-70 family)